MYDPNTITNENPNTMTPPAADAAIVTTEDAEKSGAELGHISASTAKLLDEDTATLALIHTLDGVTGDMPPKRGGAYIRSAMRAFLTDIDGNSELSDKDKAAYTMTSLFGLLGAAFGGLSEE